MYTEKDNKTVSILGTVYSIKFIPEKDLKERGIDGACDNSIKEIVVGIFEYEVGKLSDLSAYQKKVLKHEIIHAFMYESGLADCSGGVDSWATFEEMIDYFALQHDKIHEAFEKAGALM